MSVTSWVQDLLVRAGEPAVGALIALENVIPPIPSEVVLPYAGFRAARGDMTLVGAWVAATIGALVGAWVLYGIGAVFGYDRLQALSRKRWFFVVGEKDLERGMRFFDRHGGAIVLLGRCVPLVRSVVSIPAGLDRMSPVRFTVYTAIGSGVWNAVFIGAGWQLEERWERVETWVRPLGLAVVAALAAGLVFVAVRKLRGRAAARAA